MFTVPTVVTNSDLTKRSYVTFYYNDIRIREYNANSICQRINPNRATDLSERNKLLEALRYEIHKALESDTYKKRLPANETFLPSQSWDSYTRTGEVMPPTIALTSLFKALRIKLKSNLSKKYKRNLKAIYRQFRQFLTEEEKQGPIEALKATRLEEFLVQFGSTGTYYMNKRRDLGVIFAAVGRLLDQPIESVQGTSRRKVKATLHLKYDREQLQPILNYLKEHHPNLYLCCLLTYSSWLRPHEEIRLLTKGNFRNDATEVHLSGDENKGGKVRVVYIPVYVQVEVKAILIGLERDDNIFSLTPLPFGEYYFNTQWTRAWLRCMNKG